MGGVFVEAADEHFVFVFGFVDVDFGFVDGGERFLGMDLGSGNRSWLHGYVGPALVLDHQ